VASLATVGVLLAPTIAQGAVIAAAGPDFPSSVTVGKTYDASLTVFNLNQGGEIGLTNQLCNVGEAAPCGGAAERGLQLAPTCGVLTSSACTTGDPGVFQLSSTGTGQPGGVPGTSCAGIVFDITPIVGDPFGSVRFTPQIAGNHVILPGRASAAAPVAFCQIAFKFTVLKSPTIDQDPNASAPGIQTGSAADSTYCTVPCGPGSLSARGLGTDSGTTVERAGPPTITTIASPDIAPGGQLTDQATVSGLVSPVAGASVTFRLYPPSSPSCTAGSEVFTDTQIVTLAGSVATATSGAYTPPAAAVGVYHWVANYGGDANNLPATGACGEATETRSVTVAPKPPGSPEVCTTPPGPPPPGGHLCTTPPKVCTTPPGPAPMGGVLCAKGTAAIRGRTGCEGNSFNVVVTGRQIQSVTFAMDGKVVRRLTKPNSGTKYLLPVTPRKQRLGVHRIVARTIFRKQSGTKARTLRVTYSKCARRASAPAFTG
jgi:hypothetical protein